MWQAQYHQPNSDEERHVMHVIPNFEARESLGTHRDVIYTQIQQREPPIRLQNFSNRAKL